MNKLRVVERALTEVRDGGPSASLHLAIAQELHFSCPERPGQKGAEGKGFLDLGEAIFD